MLNFMSYSLHTGATDEKGQRGYIDEGNHEPPTRA
jgi:hypothetical protein